MDFYERKKQAYVLIDRLYADKVPKKVIEHKVSTDFGFGKKIVSERIESLKCISQN